MRLMMGIYAITHINSENRYIGSSINIHKRFNSHRHHLRKGKHHSLKLQNAWNKYGEEVFRFGILDYCEDLEELIAWEQQWLDTAKPQYNINPIAEKRPRYRKMSLEQKAILVARNSARLKGQSLFKGRKHSEESKAKMAKAKLGTRRSFTEEHRNKIGAATRGKPWSEARRLAHNRKKEAKDHQIITQSGRG